MKNRKGIIVLPHDMIKSDPSEDVLKAVFSTFFPVATEVVNDKFPYEDVKYFGYSPLFDEVKEGELIPEYEGVIEIINRKPILTKMIKK